MTVSGIKEKRYWGIQPKQTLSVVRNSNDQPCERANKYKLKILVLFVKEIITTNQHQPIAYYLKVSVILKKNYNKNLAY